MRTLHVLVHWPQSAVSIELVLTRAFEYISQLFVYGQVNGIILYSKGVRSLAAAMKETRRGNIHMREIEREDMAFTRQLNVNLQLCYNHK